MKAKMTFEQAMKRLEEIAQSLEGGDIPIEDSIKMYEEGIKLIEFCENKLNEAEKKIQKLSRSAEGELQLTSLEGESIEDKDSNDDE